MATCPNTSTINPGKIVTVGYAIGCGDDDPETLTYLPLGTINSKQLSYNAETTNTTNDLSGEVTSEIVVRTGLELSVSGFLTNNDSAASAQNALINYYFTEARNNRQPTVWIRIAGPGYPRIWHIYMNYKGGSESFNTDDPQTGEFNFGVTDTGTTESAVRLTDA